MKQTLKTIGSGFLGLIIGGLLVWAHMSDLVELCRSEAVSLQAELHEAEQAREAVAERLIKTEQERSQAYQWLAEQAGAKVDLSIPPKQVQVEKVSALQAETNEIAGLAKLASKFETAFKLATRGK